MIQAMYLLFLAAMMTQAAASSTMEATKRRMTTPTINPPITAVEEELLFSWVEGERFREFEWLGGVGCVVLAEGVVMDDDWPSKRLVIVGAPAADDVVFVFNEDTCTVF